MCKNKLKIPLKIENTAEKLLLLSQVCAFIAQTVRLLLIPVAHVSKEENDISLPSLQVNIAVIVRIQDIRTMYLNMKPAVHHPYVMTVTPSIGESDRELLALNFFH